jgi:tetratricopeptide (TPR) repeat protein
VFRPVPSTMNSPFPLRALLLALLCLLAPVAAWACMNDYTPNVNKAAMKRGNSLIQQITLHPTNEPWTVRRERLRKLLAEGGDFRVKNDLATTLAHTGEADEAVKLLEEVEAEKPGRYFTAANLGTAYELAGDDRKALEWIRKGIERNPDAHDGTEWLHVLILQAKLAIAEDPKWLETHSILGDPVKGKENAKIGKGVAGNRGEKLTAAQIKKAFLYQLHERLQFVKPPDAVVGALLLDLGQLVALEPVGVGASAEIVNLAVEYLRELPKSHPLMARAVANQRLAEIAQQTSDARDPVPGFWLFVAVVVLLSVLGIRWWQRI